jgi:hypothetical protein
MAKAKPARNHLLGLGLDARDGHKRITRGDGFNLVGGSEETHERMTEIVIKTSEDLGRKGRSLGEADPEEVAELIRKHEGR